LPILIRGRFEPTAAYPMEATSRTLPGRIHRISALDLVGSAGERRLDVLASTNHTGGR
jgi:hypothetical protein